MWAREMEDVVRAIMEDPVFKGNQKYSFQMDLDEAGKRLFGGKANAGVAFQIRQSSDNAGTYSKIHGICRYVPFNLKYITVCTSTYWHILVHNTTYKYVLESNSMPWQG